MPLRGRERDQFRREMCDLVFDQTSPDLFISLRTILSGHVTSKSTKVMTSELGCLGWAGRTDARAGQDIATRLFLTISKRFQIKLSDWFAVLPLLHMRSSSIDGLRDIGKTAKIHLVTNKADLVTNKADLVTKPVDLVTKGRDLVTAWSQTLYFI